MKQKIFEVGKKAYTFNQARYEEDMGRCVITAVSERYITDDIDVIRVTTGCYRLLLS